MAENIKRHISHLKSSGSTTPTAGQLIYGEIAVGYKKGEEKLFIKNSNDEVVSFDNSVNLLAAAELYTDKKSVSKVTGDSEITVTLSDESGSGRTLTVTHATGSSQSGFKKLESDSYGHITGASNVTLSDLTGLGAVSSARTITTASGLTGGGNLSQNRTIGLAAVGTAGTYKQVVVDAYGRVTSGNTADVNTFREIKVNDTSFLATTATTALNLKGGANVTLTTGSTGLVTIAATDTTYTAATSVTAVATASSVGTSENYAREDHVHNIVLATGDNKGQVKIAGTNVAVKGLSNAAYMDSASTVTATANNVLPTSKAVADYVASQMTSVLTYKGTITSNDDLKVAHKVGDVYVISSAGTYVGQACEVGDYVICKVSGASSTTVTDSHWDVINGENQVENKDATLAWNASTEIAKVDGTSITVKLPTNPNANYYTTGLTVATAATTNSITVKGNNTAVKGTATLSAATTSAAGLMSAADKTALGNLNPLSGNVSTLSAITADASAINSLTGAVGTMAFQNANSYSSATQVNTALAGKSDTGHTHDGTYAKNAFSSINVNGTAIVADSTGDTFTITGSSFITLTPNATNDTLTISVPTGTTNSTVARGDHSHSAYVNQNAYSNIKIGSTTLSAASATDTVEFAVDTNGALSITGVNGAAGADKVTFGLGNIECGDYA